MTKQTEVATLSQQSVGFVEKMLQSIETFEKAKEFGQFIINSGYAPTHFKDKPESVVLAIDAGKKIGLDWFQSLQEGFIVNGIPGYKGKILKALVQASPVCEIWETSFTGSLEKQDLTCKIKYKRRGSSVQERTFGIDNAKLAGLWGKKKKFDKNKNAWVEYDDAWCKFPQDMLEWKCVARVLNDFVDITKGFRPIEDLQDYVQEEEILATTPEGIVITNPTLRTTGQNLTEKAKEKLTKKEAPVQEAIVVDEKPASSTPDNKVKAPDCFALPDGGRGFDAMMDLAEYLDKIGYTFDKVKERMAAMGKPCEDADEFYKFAAEQTLIELTS
jgi:hypothetical protein